MDNFQLRSRQTLIDQSSILDGKIANKKPTGFFGGILVWILDFAQVIIIALAIFIVFHLFIASPHTIDGPSMEPNFCQNDLVLADKLSPRFNGYKVGDVIIFKYDEQNDYIKRILAVEGQTVKVMGGDLYRDGNLVQEPYLPQGRETNLLSGSRMVEGVEYTVPENKYFVLGDNRNLSVDSRSFLFIDPEVNTIKGRIIALIWPLKDARFFSNQELMPVNNCRTS
jgi:signal peptidase I